MAVVGGLVVQNLGGGTALNVKIDLRVPSPIQEAAEPAGHQRATAAPDAAPLQHVQVFSDEEYIVRGGGEGQRFVTLRLGRMHPGSTVILCFASHASTRPDVTVSHFQKSPVERIE